MAATSEPILGDFGNFEQTFLDHIFLINLTIEVDIKLDCNLAMLHYLRQCSENHVQEFNRRLLLFKDLQNILLEEILNWR